MSKWDPGTEFDQLDSLFEEMGPAFSSHWKAYKNLQSPVDLWLEEGMERALQGAVTELCSLNMLKQLASHSPAGNLIALDTELVREVVINAMGLLAARAKIPIADFRISLLQAIEDHWRVFPHPPGSDAMLEELRKEFQNLNGRH